ncbi:hypothetical protein BJF90_21735 [Pseudonocardia sp. CNS-004]|nr:hypothetical protein BJF90_21735 [Pseudonocardia sp. CNS-004]
MICACVVTSSALVASSATSSRGRPASAMAIITRCRIPPESWWGYSWKRRSGAGSRTSVSSSIARAFAAPRSTCACARTASVIWAPTRIVGLSERAGSWNTIAMSAPRWRRISRSGRPTSSAPSNRADPLTCAVGGSSPISARELTLLPDPDSPMTASIRPAARR